MTRMTRTLLWTLTGLLLASPAWGSDTRRQGLAGSLALEDDTDLHAFPQLARRYGNRALVDVTGQGELFRGGALFGRSTTFGFFVNRPVTGDWFEPYGADSAAILSRFAKLPDGAPLDSSSAPVDPQPLAELVLAFGNGFGFGFKLANSMDRNIQEVEEDGDTSDKEGGAQSTSLVLLGGWSGGSVARVFDLGVQLALHKFKGVALDKIQAETPWSPSFQLLARGTLNPHEPWQWVGLAQIYLRNYSVDLTRSDNNLDEGLFGLRVAAGPRITVADGITIGGLAWLGLDSHSYELSEELEGQSDEATRRAFLLPGLELAAEIQVTDWLVVRGGWHASYRLHSGEVTDGSDDPLELGLRGQQKERQWTELETGWAAGLTLQSGGVRLDGSLAPHLLNDGPNFIGGEAGGTFAWVGLTYHWGSSPVSDDEESRTRTRRTPRAPYPPGDGSLSPYGTPGFPPAEGLQ